MDGLHKFLRDWYSQVIARTARLHAYMLVRIGDAPHSRSNLPPVALSELRAEIERFAERLHEQASEILDLDAPSTDVLYSEMSVVRQRAIDFQTLHQKLQFVPAPWARPELELFLNGVLAERLPEYQEKPALRADSWTIALSSSHNFANIGIGNEPSDDDAPRLRNVLTLPAAEESNASVWPNLLHELGHMIESSSAIVREVKETNTFKKYLDAAKSAHPAKSLIILGGWVEEMVADLIATDMLGPAYFLALSSFASHWYFFPLIKDEPLHPSCDVRLNYVFQRLKDTSMRGSEILDSLRFKWLCRNEVDVHLHQGEFHDLERSTLVPPSDHLLELANAVVSAQSYRDLFAPPKPFNGELIWALQRRLATGELIATRRLREPGELEKLAGGKRLDAIREVPNDITDIVTAAIFVQNSSAAIPERLMRPIAAANGRPADYEKEVLQRFCCAEGATIGRKLEQVSTFVAAQDASVSKSIETRAIVKFYEGHALAEEKSTLND